MDIVSKIEQLIPVDISLHFYVGLAIACTLCLFLPWWVGIVSAIIAGGLKEIYNHYVPPHYVQMSHYLATILGGAYVSVLYLVKIYLVG